MIEFSFYGKIWDTTPQGNTTLLEVCKAIKNPDYAKERTEQLRKINDLAAAKKFKQTEFDHVTFSGLFSVRKTADLIKPSGLICIDIDHIKCDIPELKQRIIYDRVIDAQLIFTSPSGDGLKIVLPYDLEVFPIFEDIFKEAEKYFLQNFDIQIDKACKNIDRACFICHDPYVYINPEIKC